ncbi:hypothetical protein VNO80_16019 [Phaseolus coccineus]|uniref:Uncharacterized protein n=1 Tax=Phaseolus coccineus TaxID=3886 RepID=A0AAN9MLC6_PHACN
MDLRNRIEDWLAHLYVIEEKSRQIPLKGVPMGASTHSLTNDCNTWKVRGLYPLPYRLAVEVVWANFPFSSGSMTLPPDALPKAHFLTKKWKIFQTRNKLVRDRSLLSLVGNKTHLEGSRIPILVMGDCPYPILTPFTRPLGKGKDSHMELSLLGMQQGNDLAQGSKRLSALLNSPGWDWGHALTLTTIYFPFVQGKRDNRPNRDERIYRARFFPTDVRSGISSCFLSDESLLPLPWPIVELLGERDGSFLPLPSAEGKKGKRLAKNSYSQVDGNSTNRAKPLKEASASPRKAVSEDLCLIRLQP